MDDFEKHILLSESRVGIQIKNPTTSKAKYIDSRGNEFESELLAMISDKKFAREDFFSHLMTNRNWIQKLFNLKPSMHFYDKMTQTII